MQTIQYLVLQTRVNLLPFIRTDIWMYEARF